MPVLDGLRGIAILLVLVYHFRPPSLSKLPSAVLGLGWTGVDLFFVLSGYLITGILLDTRACSNYFTAFWVRRALRIFPLYFLALTLFLSILPGVVPGIRGALPPASDLIFYWTYSNNCTVLLENRNANHLLGHFWSLAVEEQFYLLWPVVVFVVPARRLIALLGGAILTITAARTALVFAGLDREFIYRNTFLRADALLLGASCALIVRNPRWLAKAVASLPRVAGVSALAGAAGLLAARSTYYQNPFIQTLVFPSLAWLSACAVLVALLALGSGSRLENVLRNRFLRGLGKYSYGLYVWHWPVAYFMLLHWTAWKDQLPAGDISLPLAGVAASCAAAWLSYEFFEGPILRLKHHFNPRHSPKPEPVRALHSSAGV